MAVWAAFALPEDPVTRWIAEAKGGSASAVQRLWELYFPRLVAFARARLQGRLRSADEEDAALSAFHSFCRGAEVGHFPQVHDRASLWPLLVEITAHKAANLLRAERAAKRGGAQVPSNAEDGLGIEQIVCSEPTPEFAAQLAEEYQRLLAALPDATLRQVAVWKMEGHENKEIAERLGVVERTVERKLRAIRKVWGRKGETQ